MPDGIFEQALARLVLLQKKEEAAVKVAEASDTAPAARNRAVIARNRIWPQAAELVGQVALWLARAAPEFGETHYYAERTDHRRVAQSIQVVEAMRAWWLRKTAGGRDGLAEKKGQAQRPDMEILALACLATLGPNLTEIAKQLGVPRTTLYGWPKFLARYEAARNAGAKAKRQRPRGRRAGARDFEAETD
jgi:hypothetical protein